MDTIFNLIFWTSVYSSLVAIIIIISKKLLKNIISPRWHYILWVILLLKLINPFGPESIISIFNAVPQIQSTSMSNVTDAVIPLVAIQEEITNDHTLPEPSISAFDTIQKAVPYIWLAGFIIMISWLLIANIHLRYKIRKTSVEVPANINQISNECKARMGIIKNITVVVQDAISSPAIINIFKPKVLISLKVTELNSKDISYILLHELAHCKRGDTFVNQVMAVLQCIHWFNPLIWYCFKLMRQDMELATDEKVLELFGDGCQKEYGNALLNVVETYKGNKLAPKLIGMVDDKKSLEKRIKMIKLNMLFKSRKRIVVVIGIACVLTLSALLLTNAVVDRSADEADVAGNSGVTDSTKGYGEADVSGNSGVTDTSKGAGVAEVSGNSGVTDTSKQINNAEVATLVNSDNNDFQLTISPDKYSPAMSSTPGFKFTPVNSDNTVKYECSTNSGEFLTWEKSIITQLGKQCDINSGESIYWSPLSSGDKAEIAVTIKMVKDDKVLSQKQVIIEKIDEILYSVKSIDNIVINTQPTTIDEAVSQAIKGQRKAYATGEFATEGHVILKETENKGIITAYTIASFGYFSFENGIFTKVSGSGNVPTVIKFTKDDKGQYFLKEYIEPQDGARYAKSLKDMFPSELQDKLHNDYPEIIQMQEQQAKAYLESIGRTDWVSYRIKKNSLNIDIEASNKLFSELTKNDEFLNNCPTWIGTREVIEAGESFIYRTLQDKNEKGYDRVIFRKLNMADTVIEERIYTIKGHEPFLEDIKINK